MQRRLAILTALALAMTACTQDPPPDDPTPTATVVPTDEETAAVPETTEDDDEPTDEPTESDEPTEEPTATGEPTEGPTEDVAQQGGATTPLGTWTRTTKTIAGGGSDFATTPPVNRAWSGNAAGACQVAPAAGEVHNSCVSVQVNSKNASLSVVDVTSSEGARSVRVYRADSSGANVSTLAANHAADRVVASDWPSGDGLVEVRLDNLERAVIGWLGSEPTVVANLRGQFGGEEVSFVAGHIVRRFDEQGGGDLSILVPGATESTGVHIEFESSDPPPTDIALRVYKAWIAGDFAAMQGLATEDVIAALQRTRTTKDLFTLANGACAVEASQATCTFGSSAGNSTWTLERRGGNVQVVALK